MKPDLAARLNLLKKGQSAPAVIPAESAPASEAAPPPAEWTALDRDVWKREISCPDPMKDMPLSGYLVPDGIPSRDWLFFDTETTGLSGGAGNTAFLIGLGRQKGEDFLTTQYFLRDYPGEPFMLDLLKEDLKSSGLFISYNGKSYDSPLLQTRFLMNRMPFQFGPHLDLLYPVRRLFKRTLPNCRLGTCESFLLQKPRQGDIPGSEIPDLWFSFLRDNRPEILSQVFEHNRLDIVRMADLLVFLEETLSNPGQSRPYRDLYALGRFLTDREDPRGEEFLEMARYRGDPRAETYLSVYWKRRGEWDKAVRLWQSILKRRPGLFAGVELAKYLEHREKALPDALELVERLLRELPLRDPLVKEKLQHRRRRLLAKMAKQSDNE